MAIELEDCTVQATELNPASFMHLARYIANVPTNTYGDAPHATGEDHRYWVEDLFDPEKRKQVIANLPNISEDEARTLAEVFCHVFALRGTPEQSSQTVSMWRYCYDSIARRIAIERTAGQVGVAGEIMPMLPNEREDIFLNPQDYSKQELEDKLREVAGNVTAIRMLINSIPGIGGEQSYMAEAGY